MKYNHYLTISTLAILAACSNLPTPESVEQHEGIRQQTERKQEEQRKKIPINAPVSTAEILDWMMAAFLR